METDGETMRKAGTDFDDVVEVKATSGNLDISSSNDTEVPGEIKDVSHKAEVKSENQKIFHHLFPKPKTMAYMTLLVQSLRY